MNTEEKSLLGEFLRNGSLKQYQMFIERAEKQKVLKWCSFVGSIKKLFVAVAFEKLKVLECKIPNRRQKVVVETFEGRNYFFASTKSWEDENELYGKVYDLYKYKLLEMVEQIDSKTPELEAIAI